VLVKSLMDETEAGATARKPKRETLSIRRPLRNFEVDKYWVKIAAMAFQDSWSLVFEKFSWWKVILPTVVAIVTSGIQFYVLGWASMLDNVKILGTSVGAGLCVFGVLLIIHLVRKPCELYIGATKTIAKLSKENERLKRPVIDSLVLAEEDPKVHLAPLNGEYPTLGIIPFDLSNLGQRVNPAYRIRITIPIAPSVTFEYVNVLEMAQHKRIVPTVEDCENILSHHNILPVLDKAWTTAKGISDSDEAWKDLELEFSFDMKAIYQDASGHRSFETIVSLTYCPLDAHAARRGATFRQLEYAILKVTDVQVRRVA
jgi:hypothetical protein